MLLSIQPKIVLESLVAHATQYLHFLVIIINCSIIIKQCHGVKHVV